VNNVPQRREGLLAVVCVIAMSAISAAQSVNALSISGTVVSAKGGTPLAKVRIVVADVKNSDNVQSSLTAEDGRFDFRVAPGKYSLQAAKRGFIPSSYNQHD
jgi:curli biogenesis system outer membrane secretion channel CsgG